MAPFLSTQLLVYTSTASGIDPNSIGLSDIQHASTLGLDYLLAAILGALLNFWRQLSKDTPFDGVAGVVVALLTFYIGDVVTRVLLDGFQLTDLSNAVFATLPMLPTLLSGTRTSNDA